MNTDHARNAVQDAIVAHVAHVHNESLAGDIVPQRLASITVETVLEAAELYRASRPLTCLEVTGAAAMVARATASAWFARPLEALLESLHSGVEREGDEWSAWRELTAANAAQVFGIEGA